MLPREEERLSVPKAYEKANGHRPHPSTCHRHRLNGVKGVKLETEMQGGRRVTSVEAVLRFNRAVTAAADGERVSTSACRQREAAISRAERELADSGI